MDGSESPMPAPRHAGRLPWRLARMLGVLVFIGFIFWISGCMEHMFYYPTAGPTPVPAELAARGGESVRFQSSDGTRLHGWFIPARGGNPGGGVQKAATILHVHGNAGNIESHIWFTEYLPAAGFNLFIFDYRGYGESEGRPRKRGPLIADTTAALDAILKRGDVDPQRIGMYGQSLGGSIGLNVMADRPEIRAAVIESAFTSWRDMAACALGGGDSPGAASRALTALLIPDSNRPDQAIARIDRPILLLHGTSDSIVPVTHSRKLADAAGADCEIGRKNAELIELPGGDHNSLRDSHPEIEERVIEFFRRHLH